MSENLLDNSENEGKLTTKVEKASLIHAQVAASTPLQNSELRVCATAVCGGAVRLCVRGRKRKWPTRAERSRSELTESVELIVRNWDISPQFDAIAGGRGARATLQDYAI